MLGVKFDRIMLVKQISMFCFILSEHGQDVNCTGTTSGKNIAQFLDGLVVSWVYDVLSFTLSCGYDMENIMLLQIRD